MRISDWSSDVCSSDLTLGHLGAARLPDERDMIHIGAAVGPLKGARQRRGSIALVKSFAWDDFVIQIFGQRRQPRRSEERRVGKECVSQCRSRWSPYH